MQALNQLIACCILGKIPGAPSFEGGCREHIFTVHTENKNGYFDLIHLELLKNIQSVSSGQVDIQNNDIPFLVFYLVEYVSSIRRLAEFHSWKFSNKYVFDPGPDSEMIIGYKYSFVIHCP